MKEVTRKLNSKFILFLFCKKYITKKCKAAGARSAPRKGAELRTAKKFMSRGRDISQGQTITLKVTTTANNIEEEEFRNYKVKKLYRDFALCEYLYRGKSLYRECFRYQELGAARQYDGKK